VNSSESSLEDYIEFLRGEKDRALSSANAHWILAASNELTRAEDFLSRLEQRSDGSEIAPDDDESTQHLWEILVPTVRNDGRPFRLRYHKVWDERVKAISGGLTIVPPVNGVWVSPDEETFEERMIPVRIMCTREEILSIAQMSKEYYEQEAIMVHRVSREVYIID